MPFTPYHMGFGLAAKATQPSKISLLMFGFSQVAIDLQQGYKHATHPGEHALHGLSHTILGATIIALLCLPFRRMLEKVFQQKITSTAAAWGVFIGVYSHLVLDSIVHLDVNNNLLMPFYRADCHLFGLISPKQMDMLCLYVGIFAVLILLIRGVIQESLRNFLNK